MNKLGIDIKMKNEKGIDLLFKKIKLDSLIKLRDMSRQFQSNYPK